MSLYMWKALDLNVIQKHQRLPPVKSDLLQINLNVFYSVLRRSWQNVCCIFWTGMLKKKKPRRDWVNYITSHLHITDGVTEIAEQHIQSWPSETITFMGFLPRGLPPFPLPLPYLSELIAAWRPFNSLFPILTRRSRKRAVRCSSWLWQVRNVLSGELWFGSVGINLASASFSHWLSKPPPTKLHTHWAATRTLSHTRTFVSFLRPFFLVIRLYVVCCVT